MTLISVVDYSGEANSNSSSGIMFYCIEPKLFSPKKRSQSVLTDKNKALAGKSMAWKSIGTI